VDGDIFKPELTLPPEEAEWIQEVYANAEVILEYGSGGSTLVASELPGKTIFSVESDKAWLENLEAYLELNPGQSPVILHHGDIGPTKEWGAPVNGDAWRKFHRYPLSVWDRDDFVHPDTVLIDGRFRKACLLTTLFRATKPCTVYFDDYMNRPKYHEVEDFVPRAENRGRMARFEIEPAAIQPADLTRIITIFGQQA